MTLPLGDVLHVACGQTRGSRLLRRSGRAERCLLGLLADGLAQIRQELAHLPARLAKVLFYGALGTLRGAFVLELAVTGDDPDGFFDATLQLLHLAARFLLLHGVSLTRFSEHATCHAEGTRHARRLNKWTIATKSAEPMIDHRIGKACPDTWNTRGSGSLS